MNIGFMSVAPLEENQRPQGAENEALMILGVDKPVDSKTIQELIASQGILEASVVQL